MFPPQSTLHLVLGGAALLGACACVTGMIRVRAQVSAGRWRPVDGRTRAWWARRRSTRGLALARAAAVPGKPASLLVTAALLAAWLALANAPGMSGLVALAALLATLGQGILKRRFDRSRPPRAVAEGTQEPSFPSGHAAGTLGVYGAAVYALDRGGALPWSVTTPLAVALCLLALFAQLYRERHWLSDFVGGYLLGAAVCLFVIGGAQFLEAATA